MAKLLGVYAIAAAIQFPIAWLLMLIVGIVHAGWLTGLPTIGYWTSLLLCALLCGTRFLQAIVIAAIKNIGESAKSKPAGPPSIRVATNGANNTMRMHWVDPAKFNRDLL